MEIRREQYIYIYNNYCSIMYYNIQGHKCNIQGHKCNIQGHK